MYSVTGAVYLVRTDHLIEHRSWRPDGALAYVMPPERSMDSDTERDLNIAELIMQDRLTRQGALAA